MPTKELSSAELHLWNIVENNPDKIAKMSIVKLSQFANVSTATIVRTMQKMGYSGYTSYREALKLKSKSNSTFTVLNDADDKIRSVITKNEIEMNNTLHNLNYSTIEDSISMTKQAKIVYLFARGLSESIAHEMMVKLQLTGKYCEFHSDPNIIMTIANKLNHDALAIFITLNGETKELVKAAKTLRKNDIPILTFTTNPAGSILAFSTLSFIGYKSKTNYFPEYEVRSRLPLQIMTRIFCDAYSVRTNFFKTN
ncbi:MULTISPECIES: MurR/RpiR family transcriptional regulator [Lactobacillus]|uniref:MurR/RpiR family transcriptional regulator n=1 Tax=Lactobacillus TaxID=1578 RepID=UPI001C69F9FB|nr:MULTISPECIES: MurR/RpiR family transcriptional regulator [Lactobacillus]MCX8720936.1 MurR/RpiR family transcriptional regulator [Lactobacillus sp. B4010]MCX8724385.1 MurR/RpiR family transcriptional regulator [Lactobacillus sp. B4005]MCX8733083.1 MurR/RpiR family transcriptional regulator [Lactobacillus sp. B4015]MCX8735197.1 MurR/RpiR family transcriptional regulator [Lactobacillus sp. B4012]QYN56083.1 MurR/RpiR family transcriptional regulator [Lactobacillus panisapium]